MTLKKLTAPLAIVALCVSYAIAQQQQTANQGQTDSAQQTQTDSTRNYSTDSTLQGQNANQQSTGVEQTSNFRGDLNTTRSNTHRASELIGLNVMTPNNEDTIGEIDDLVITQDGKVRYAAVSVGGFLGIGDKLVAVPWQSFQHRADEDGDHIVTLNTTKEKLENAPGFNQDNWPDFANPQWSTENDRHYGVSVNVNTDRSID